eukprot:1228714-Amphidinium_carterae.2
MGRGDHIVKRAGGVPVDVGDILGGIIVDPVVTHIVWCDVVVVVMLWMLKLTMWRPCGQVMVEGGVKYVCSWYTVEGGC